MTVFCTFGGGGIILEFEAGLEATGKKLVCENSASKGVIEKNWTKQQYHTAGYWKGCW
jgi:hypothetical protein